MKYIQIVAKVVPNSSFERINNISFDMEGKLHLSVRVTATPENNKANKAVIALLAKWLCISKSSIEITHGNTNRNKLLVVHGLDKDDIVTLINSQKSIVS